MMLCEDFSMDRQCEQNAVSTDEALVVVTEKNEKPDGEGNVMLM